MGQTWILKIDFLLKFQILLKTFIPNLKSSSATMRRTAGSTLNVICQNSRNPSRFYAWLINMLLGKSRRFLLSHYLWFVRYMISSKEVWLNFWKFSPPSILRPRISDLNYTWLPNPFTSLHRNHHKYSGRKVLSLRVGWWHNKCHLGFPSDAFVIL